MIISADYEDGLGRWLPDAPLLPSNMALGAANDEDLAFEKGFITARQARSLGVDWVFAPVLDLADNALNPIVNTRSFGKDPAQVIKLGRAFLTGLKKGGVLGCIKHFPGHGDTTTDSHVALPVLHKTKQQLLARELVPFQALLKETDSVMLGHLLLPKIDEKYPTSLSPAITGLLRNDWKYDGCLLTDALLMKAIGDEKQAALQALQNGVDILLVPQDPAELIDFLEAQKIPAQLILQALSRQENLFKRLPKTPRPAPEEAFAPTDFVSRTAQKAVTLSGTLTPVKPGQMVQYLLVGEDGKTSANVFLETLEKNGVKMEKFAGQADYLLVISLRRYQAFSGQIALVKQEEEQVKKAVASSKQATSILLASPWALPPDWTGQAQLLTFSPAPEFQQTAAEILLGKRPALGTLPVSL